MNGKGTADRWFFVMNHSHSDRETEKKRCSKLRWTLQTRIVYAHSCRPLAVRGQWQSVQRQARVAPQHLCLPRSDCFTCQNVRRSLSSPTLGYHAWGGGSLKHEHSLFIYQSVVTMNAALVIIRAHNKDKDCVSISTHSYLTQPTFAGCEDLQCVCVCVCMCGSHGAVSYTTWLHRTHIVPMSYVLSINSLMM